MSPRHRANRSSAPATRSYARLEKNLALLNWLHRQVGFDDTLQLLKDIKPINEGFDENGRSFICNYLASRSGQMCGLSTDDLQRYDVNISDHLESMNADRPEPITLRYFQYLAALYSEIYLDNYFNRPDSLLISLKRIHHPTQHAFPIKPTI